MEVAQLEASCSNQYAGFQLHVVLPLGDGLGLCQRLDGASIATMFRGEGVGVQYQETGRLKGAGWDQCQSLFEK